MNIRFSQESVRMRVSLDEARALEREGKVTQRIPFIEGEMLIGVSLVHDQNEAALFRYLGREAQAFLREGEFLDLLAEKPSRESCITIQLKSYTGTPLEFVFEIDLFSRKPTHDPR